MTDMKANVKIEFHFMGKTYAMDSYINYSGADGVDERVVEFFQEAYDDGMKRYNEQVRKYYMEKHAKEIEQEEREILAALKAKYEPTLVEAVEHE